MMKVGWRLDEGWMKCCAPPGTEVKLHSVFMKTGSRAVNPAEGKAIRALRQENSFSAGLSTSNPPVTTTSTTSTTGSCSPYSMNEKSFSQVIHQLSGLLLTSPPQTSALVAALFL